MLDAMLFGLLDIFFRRVELLVLAGLAWEENKAILVSLEAGDVESEGFLGGVLAAGVDWDADCGCEFAGDTCFLKLHQSESPSCPKTAVVFERRTSDDGSEFINWSRCDSCGFRETSGTTAGFATWLIEVHSDTALPVLVEVVVRDLLVVLDRHYDR